MYMYGYPMQTPQVLGSNARGRTCEQVNGGDNTASFRVFLVATRLNTRAII